MSAALARKSIIRCRCICRSVSTTSDIVRATCRKANKRRERSSRYRCSRNSPRPSRATSWSRFRTFIRERRFRLFESHGRARAFANLAAEWPAALFRRHSCQFTLAILDLAQLAQDLRLFFHVLAIVDFSVFQPQLQLQQSLFHRGVVGVLLFRHFGQRAEDELHAVNRHEQEIINKKHQLAVPRSSLRRMFTKL